MTDKTPTQLLKRIQAGDDSYLDQLFSVVYSELRVIANRELSGNVLSRQFSSTDLVHEAYMKLVDQKESNWKSRTHFFSVGAKVMRHILVDRARANMASKRGSGVTHQLLEDGLLSHHNDAHVLAVEDALQHLEEVDPVQAKIVEARFFGGMTVEEVADLLGKSKRWVEAEWTMIRAWLRAELSED